jgi:lipid-binding SYLF domain-containing protein
LDGSTLRPDKEANRELYDSELTNQEIVMGETKAPVAAAELMAYLNRYSARKE